MISSLGYGFVERIICKIRARNFPEHDDKRWTFN